MEFRNLITKFAERLGIHDLAFDEDGVVRLAADEMTLAFMEMPEHRSLLIWSNVATPSSEHLEDLYKVLLEASFMGRGTHGGTFSLENGTVYLHRTDALVNLDVEALTKIVEDFLGLVGTYRQIIEAYHVPAVAKPAAEEHEIPGGGFHSHAFHSHGFLRV